MVQTSSRQQRVLLRLLASAYGTPSWVLTPDLMGHHCSAEGLSAPEAVRLAEDVIASGVVLFRVLPGKTFTGPAMSGHSTTLVPLGAQEATGEVRAYVETAELRAIARRGSTKKHV